MKITIEIPDHLYGEEWDDEGNITVPSPPIGERAKRERLLDRAFDERESFRFDVALLVVHELIEMTPGYVHPEIVKANESHQKLCKHHLTQCYDL